MNRAVQSGQWAHLSSGLNRPLGSNNAREVLLRLPIPRLQINKRRGDGVEADPDQLPPPYNYVLLPPSSFIRHTHIKIQTFIFLTNNLIINF